MAETEPVREDFAADLQRVRNALRWYGTTYRGQAPTQAEFAERFGLTFGMVKDQEQGRARPSRPLMVLLVLIEEQPSLVHKAARVAEAKWPGEFDRG